MKSRFFNYLFWLVIAAAFIGPGTVTTAASAGASYQYQLIWAMIFSTFACLVLQEAAARITILTGRSLGQAIRERFKNGSFVWLIGGAILIGCLAYEAGNILGAISGILLVVSNVPQWIFTLSIGLAALAVLYLGRTTVIANILGVLVGIMGIAFLIAAFSAPLDTSALTNGALVPSLPKGSLMLVLGLIGTTIVPYNIFLGSSLAEGQGLKEMRKGLSFSVILGGVISISVILVGAQLNTAFSFSNLYNYLVNQNGSFMGWLFAIGLFAAGFTSTITASLAGALTVKSIHKEGASWQEKTFKYQRIWILVLMVGVIVGMSGLKPIPVIILAQAANGLILPLLTYAIWLVLNSDLLGDNKNGILANAFMAITLVVTSILGLLNVIKAGYSALGTTFELSSNHLMIIGFLSIGLVLTALGQMKKTKS